MQNNGSTYRGGRGECHAPVTQHIREFVAEVAAIREAGAEKLSDTLAHWLAAHYVTAARRAAVDAGAEGLDLKTLRGFIGDVVALRRGDHSAERLNIDREQLDLNRELSKERREKLFWEWAAKPENKNLICHRGLSAEERARRIRQIFRTGDPSDAEESCRGLTRETLEMIEREAKLL